MRSALAIIAAVLMCSFPVIVFAETKEIIAEGTYNMGDGETPSVAEIRALLKAKQIALEQAGTYVESYSNVKNIVLTNDEIQVLASGLIEVEIMDKKRTIVSDGIKFWVKIRTRVSMDRMEDMAARIREKPIVEDYMRMQKAYEVSQREIEHLKKQLINATTSQQKKEAQSRIEDDEAKFVAADKVKDGMKYVLYDKYQAALEAFSLAINTYRANPLAYFERGNLYYFHLGKKEAAISDYSMAIQYDSQNVDAYFYRGCVYINLGRFSDAIEDLNRVLNIRPGRVFAYYKRGQAYAATNRYEEAAGDYRKIFLKDNGYNKSAFIFFTEGTIKADLIKGCEQGSKESCSVFGLYDEAFGRTY